MRQVKIIMAEYNKNRLVLTDLENEKELIIPIKYDKNYDMSLKDRAEKELFERGIHVESFSRSFPSGVVYLVVDAYVELIKE